MKVTYLCRSEYWRSASFPLGPANKKIFIPGGFTDGFIGSTDVEHFILIGNSYRKTFLSNFVYWSNEEPKIVVRKDYYHIMVHDLYADDPFRQTGKEFDTRVLCSNVEFHLNYDTDNEVFWIDIYDEGDLIKKHYGGEYELSREGYVFAGWHTEPECINKWDFDKDVMPKIEFCPTVLDDLPDKIEDVYSREYSDYRKEVVNRIYPKWDNYEPFKLYAKWIEE